MPVITRIRTFLTGTAVTGGGLMDLYVGSVTGVDVQDAAGLIREFFDDIAAVSSQYQASWEAAQATIDDGTGEITGYIQIDPPDALNLGTAPIEALATQGLIRWPTTGVVASRRVQGRTFIPGIAKGAIDTSGNLSGAGTIANAANSLLNSLQANESPLLVWSRPFAGNEDRPARVGSSYEVVSASVPLKPAVLRSRRD